MFMHNKRLQYTVRVSEPRLEQIEFSAAIHLPFDQFEFRDLAFGLPVRPW